MFQIVVLITNGGVAEKCSNRNSYVSTRLEFNLSINYYEIQKYYQRYIATLHKYKSNITMKFARLLPAEIDQFIINFLF